MPRPGTADSLDAASPRVSPAKMHRLDSEVTPRDGEHKQSSEEFKSGNDHHDNDSEHPKATSLFSETNFSPLVIGSNKSKLFTGSLTHDMNVQCNEGWEEKDVGGE